MRDRLLAGLTQLDEVYVNGDLTHRIPHNLNVSFNFVEGESLIMGIKGVAVSSGSACTSASLEPSYVLRALGRSDELAHSSIRFTLGRFTTEAEVDEVIRQVQDTVAKLRALSPLWDMHLEGIDLEHDPMGRALIVQVAVARTVIAFPAARSDATDRASRDRRWRPAGPPPSIAP